MTARQIEAGETTITLRCADTSDWIRTESGEWLRGGVDWMGDDIYLLIFWSTQLTYTTIGNTNHTGTADLFIEVTNIFNFNVSFLYLRTEKPPPRANGTFPVKNDFQLIVGIALQFG